MEPKKASSILTFYPLPAWSLLLFLYLSLNSCFQSSKLIKSDESLFSLSLGKLPSQVYVLTQDKFIPDSRNFVRTNKGSIYISDKISKKIMGFTSYGDLIFLLHNNNPSMHSGVSNFTNINYPFNEIGLFEVASQGDIYVQEEIPTSSQINDLKEGMVLKNQILHFDSKGTYKETIGQNGVGTEPFGVISQICTNNRGDLIVISQLPTKKVIYWFTSQGLKLWQIDLEENSLPFPKEYSKNNLFPHLENILPSPDANKIYLNIVYYETLTDANTRSDMGVHVKTQKIFSFNIDTKSYDEEISLPLYANPTTEMRYVLELLKISSENLILEINDDNLINRSYILLNRKNEKIQKKTIKLPTAEILDINLSSENILTGLFLKKDKVSVYWWPIGYVKSETF